MITAVELAINVLISRITFIKMNMRAVFFSVSLLIFFVVKLTTAVDLYWEYNFQEDGDTFGWSIASDDTHVVISAPTLIQVSYSDYFSAFKPGKVLVYTESSPGQADWYNDETTLQASDGYDYDYFGNIVDIFGLNVYVGAHGNYVNTVNSVSYEGSPGYVYVYTESVEGAKDWGNSETKIAMLDDNGNRSLFGRSLAVDKITGVFAANAPRTYVGSGANKIYIMWETSPGAKDWQSNQVDIVIDSTSWNWYTSSNGYYHDMSVSGPHVVICNQPTQNTAGQVKIYSETAQGNHDWSSTPTTLMPSSSGLNDQFGKSARMNGLVLVVGASMASNSPGSGGIFVFRESSLGMLDWASSEHYIAAWGSHISEPDHFGETLVFQNNKIAVVTPRANVMYSPSPMVEVLEESSAGANDWSVTETHMWEDYDYFTANDGVGYQTSRNFVYTPNGLLFMGAPTYLKVSQASMGFGRVLGKYLCPGLNRLEPCDCEGTGAYGKWCLQPCPSGVPEDNVNLGTLNGFPLWEQCNCDATNMYGTTCTKECVAPATDDPTNAWSTCNCTGMNAVSSSCSKSCNNGIADELFKTCNCTESGASGTYCQKDIDDCASAPCLNMGTCSDYGSDTFPNHANEFNCTCPPGYAGAICEESACVSFSPCLHDGTCFNDDKVALGLACNCSGTGYEGDLCETEIDECMSFPCNKGLPCTNLIADYSCDCTDSGYTDKNCDTDIDDCASSPCSNDATCKDKGANKFQCNCADGYTGTLCDMEIDQCLSSPCVNDGVCTSALLSFTCDCTNTGGFEGLTCETPIETSWSSSGGTDPCMSMPCSATEICVLADDSSSFECFTDCTLASLCTNPVEAEFTGLSCDAAGIVCSDEETVEDDILTILVNEFGGLPDDYVVDVVLTSEGTYDLTIEFTNPEDEFTADTFEAALAASPSISTPVLTGDTSSSSYEGGASQATTSFITFIFSLFLTAKLFI